MTFSVWHFGVMILFSYGTLSHTVPKGSCRYVHNNVTNLTEKLVTEGNLIDFFIFGLAAIYLCFAVCLVANFFLDLRRIVPESKMWFIVPTFTLENFSFATTSLTLILTYILKNYVCSDLWLNFLAISITTGWMVIFIVFHLGDKNSFFIYLFYSSINEGIVRIGVMILCLIVAMTIGTITFFICSMEENADFSMDNPMGVSSVIFSWQ